MKNFYTLILSVFCLSFVNSQTFEFSISYVGVNGSTNNHQIALIATPSSTVTNGITADMGAGFYVPSGLTIGNFVMGNSSLPASEWSSQTLGSSNSNGDPYFVSRTEAGSSSVVLNGDGPFELVLFDVIADPNPTSGEIKFVENGDPVFNEILFIENYIEINLGTGTSNAYSQNNPSANSIDFSTLSTDNVLLEKSISFYPNPTTSKVFIENTPNIELKSATIFDITGKQIIYKVLDNSNTIKEISLKSLPNGLYLIKLESNSATLTKRIIKK